MEEEGEGNVMCSTDQFIGEHEYELDALLPYHLPKVSGCVLHGTLCHHKVMTLLVDSELRSKEKY